MQVPLRRVVRLCDMSVRSENSNGMMRHWATACVIVIVAAGLLFAVHAGLITITGKPSRDVQAIIVVSELSFYLWVRVLSGMCRRHQLVTLAAFIAFQAGVFSIIRMDGFTGDGRPVWTWRWASVPEDALRRRLSSDNGTRSRRTATFGIEESSESAGFPHQSLIRSCRPRPPS